MTLAGCHKTRENITNFLNHTKNKNLKMNHRWLVPYSCFSLMTGHTSVSFKNTPKKIPLKSPTGQHLEVIQRSDLAAIIGRVPEARGAVVVMNLRYHGIANTLIARDLLPADVQIERATRD
jgi:hypothetical protein